MSDVEVRVPELGDFASVDVIDVHVKPGDEIGVEDPLLTLETDKAIDGRARASGRDRCIGRRAGRRESRARRSDPDLAARAGESGRGAGGRRASARGAAAAVDCSIRRADAGAGERPGERRARAVAGIERGERGGRRAGAARRDRRRSRRLHRGVSRRRPRSRGHADRALAHARWRLLERRLHPVEGAAARGTRDRGGARDGAHGVAFGRPQLDAAKLRSWKNGVVRQLTGGLDTLAKQRKVRVVRGTARFIGPNRLEVDRDGARETLDFEQCVIAAGSEPSMLPSLPSDPRIIDSTGALELGELPERMLVIGGGIIGLEMATVYDALGVKVTVVELTKTLIPGCDRDLVKPLEKRIAARYEAILLGTRVTRMEAGAAGITVHFEGDNAPPGPQVYGCVLVAVGRSANGRRIEAERAGVEVDERGLIRVDKQQRTNVPHIFAIGDIVGQPMLAHKATHEGKVAAEVAAGKKSFFDARVVPAVAYTDPEVAWVGLTEEAAKANGTAYEKGTFPWVASARSLTLGRSDGLTKLLFDGETGRLLGAGIVGTNAGDLIAEAALAIEMGCNAEDIGLTVHPHPTLSETLAFAAEAAEGTITDLYIPKRR